MTNWRTLSNVFGVQVWNTGGAIFPTGGSGGANAPPVKQSKNALKTDKAESDNTKSLRRGW